MKFSSILALAGLFVVGIMKPASKSESLSDSDFIESCSTTASESIDDHIEPPQLGATAQLITKGKKLAAQKGAGSEEAEVVGISLMKKSEEKQRLISELTTRIEIISSKITKVSTAAENTFDELAKTQETVAYYEGVLSRLKAQLLLWKSDGTVLVRDDNDDDDEPQTLSADQAERLTGMEVAIVLEPGVRNKEKVIAEINGELQMLKQQHGALSLQRQQAERELANAQASHKNQLQSAQDIDGTILGLAGTYPDAMAKRSVDAIKQRRAEEARRELSEMKNRPSVAPEESKRCLLL